MLIRNFSGDSTTSSNSSQSDSVVFRKKGHSYEPFYRCLNNCGKVYQNKGSVKLHMKYECGKDPQFHCSICQKKFKRPDSLRTHMGIVHKVVV